MKKNITYNQMKQLYGIKHGFDSDYYARQIGQLFMKTYHMSNISETRGNDCIDTIGYLDDGTRCVVEIKERRMTSGKFNDHMCEASKLDNFKQFYDDGNSRPFLLSIFENNTLVLSNQYNYIKQEVKLCPATTELNDHRMVNKLCNIYEQTNKIKFNIIYDTDKNSVIIDFDIWKEPTSIELF